LLFEDINALKDNLRLKILKATRRVSRNAEFLLSTEINLTTSSDEGDKQEYFFTSSKIFSSIKTKLAKSFHLTFNH
jgi:hypothetical protein